MKCDAVGIVDTNYLRLTMNDIPEEDLRKFMEIWELEIGTKLTRDEAAAKAAQLIDLYAALSKKLPEE